MKQLTFRLEGTSPLLMHNGQLANPMNSFTRKLNTLSKKGRGMKEEAELMKIAQYEFLGSLYTNGNQEIGFPGSVIFTVLRNGARKFKQGKSVESGLIVRRFYPIEYDGPQDPHALFEYEDEQGNRPFVDQRMVGVQRNKVLRTRPYFENWAVEVDVEIDVNLIEPANMLQYVEAAGVQCGIGDARSLGFGRFKVTQI